MNAAFQDGVRAGAADRLLGIRSAYSWASAGSQYDNYAAQYGWGYRLGWLGLA